MLAKKYNICLQRMYSEWTMGEKWTCEQKLNIKTAQPLINWKIKASKQVCEGEQATLTN